MNLQEIQSALGELIASGGTKADATLSIEAGGMFVFFRPAGWGQENPSILARGATPKEAIAEAWAQWDKMRASVRAEQVKKMALAIIRLTHENGQCTDAGLRAEFDTKDVERYGAEAVDMANAMAANGPFSISTISHANAA